MVKCKFHRRCNIYDKNKVICNKDGGGAIRGYKCGKYKELQDKKYEQRRLIDFVR